MSTPQLQIVDNTVVLQPEGLPVDDVIAQAAAVAAQAAAGDRIASAASYGGSFNLFDLSTAIPTGEIQFNGGLYGTDNSIASQPIFIGDLPTGTQLTFSGMAANPAIDRVYAFYSALPTAINAAEPATITYGQIAAGPSFTVSVPAGAQYIRFTPRQRQPGGGSIATTQLEIGAVATPFRAYEPALVRFEGRRIGRQATLDADSASVGPVAIFGDSITRTEDVNGGHYAYGGGARANWPDYALPIINPSAAYNFAIESASFATRSDTSSNFEKFQYQIDVALAQNLTPASAIVALGINDFRFLNGSLGSFATAMGKSYSALDETVPIESARKGFYRLQQAWPNAVKFVSLPLQNGQVDMTALKAWNATIAQMANRYGFEVIDAYSETGIVADFENTTTAGQDLVDGLHPGPSGQRKQGRLIGKRVSARTV